MNISYYKRTFFCSFAIILLLAAPLTVFQLYTEYRARQSERHRLEQEVDEYACSLMENFDRELTNLENISLCMQNSRVLRPYNYDGRSLTLEMKNMIIHEIGNLNKTNGFVDEILFCIKGNQTAYSSLGIYNLNTLVPSIYPFSAWSNTQFIYDVNTARDPIWRKNERIMGKGNYICLIYPIPLHNSSPYASILYLINEQDFEKKLLAHLPPGAVARVFSDHGEMLYTNAPSVSFEEQEGEQGLFYAHDYEENAYCAAARISVKNRFRFAVYIPQTLLFSETAQGPHFWEICLRVLSLIVAAALLSCLLCLPWKRVARRLSLISGKPLKECGDPAVFCGYVERLQEINRQLRQKCEGVEQAVREYAYTQILQGKYESAEQLDDWAREDGVSFRHSFYFICNMQLTQTKEPLSNRDWIKRLHTEEKKWVLGGYECHIKDSYLPGIFFLLFGCDSGDSRQIEKDLNGMRDIVSVLTEGDVSFGVGSICSEFRGISHSFLESCSVQKYQILNGTNRVLMPSLLTRAHLLPRLYPAGLIQKISDGFQMRSREKTQSAVKELTDHLHSTRYSSEMLSLILSDVVSTLLKHGQEIENLYGDEFPALFARLCALHTLDEMQAALIELAERFPEQPAAAGERPSLEISGIYRYIEEHYCDYDFSVQKLSEHFGVSPSNMAHIFKRNTNRTVIDYVNKKRIERASDLLENSDMTLKEIVKNIGFSDSSAFIKRFRTYYGMTPGQFREKNSAKG